MPNPSTEAKLNRLLVVEALLEKRPEGFEHIFSYYPNNDADSFPDDYIDWEEYQKNYDGIFKLLMELLEKWNGNPAFQYRGVNLLWAFKKRLFNHAHEMNLRHVLRRRLVERLKPAGIYALNQNHEVYPLDQAPLPAVEAKRAVRHSAWPARISWGSKKKCGYVVFSDYVKARSVIRELGPANVVYYTSARAPRIFWRAIRDGFKYHQNVCDGTGRGSDSRVEGYVNQIGKMRPFKGFHASDFSLEDAMTERLAALFLSELRGLLKDIDAYHSFFRSVPELKSGLLDEDMAPSKNAFCQVARQYQVRTYVESHGALGEKSGFLPLTADGIFVWGNAQKAKMVAWGCDSMKIHVSGSARYKPYQVMDAASNRRRVFQDFKLDPQMPMAAVAFPPVTRRRLRFFENRWKKMFEETLEVLSGVTDVQFVLKIKPRSGDEMRDLAAEWIRKRQLNHVTIAEIYDPLKIIKAADFVITFGSTFAVEGLALDKEVILLYDAYSPLLVEFRPYNVFCYSNSAEDLRNWIARLRDGIYKTSDHSRKSALQECLNHEALDPALVIARRLAGRS